MSYISYYLVIVAAALSIAVLAKGIRSYACIAKSTVRNSDKVLIANITTLAGPVSLIGLIILLADPMRYNELALGFNLVSNLLNYLLIAEFGERSSGRRNSKAS